MRIQALVTDAFGGQGGIAKFNRDLLTALCSHPKCTGVTAFPRLMPNLPGPLPEKLTYVTEGLNSKIRYAQCVLKKSFHRPKADLLICGHIHLLPLARLMQCINRVPSALIIHGVDAWQPTHSRLANLCAPHIQTFLAVSDFTKQRFLGWTGLQPEQGYILPNSIAIEDFGPGAPDGRLLDRYRLHGRKVILTLGRLSAQERYKGIDEVMEALPALARDVPNLTYLIAGDGTDRARLQEKAKSLGLSVLESGKGKADHISAFQCFSVSAFSPQVVFTGYIPENEKADHYRLADAFVMPGWGEGFGIVYLEAMACGIPVVASKLDASREAVRNGELGILVDPKNPHELQAGILEALRRPKGTIPAGLAYFSFANFRQRCHRIVDELIGRLDGKAETLKC